MKKIFTITVMVLALFSSYAKSKASSKEETDAEKAIEYPYSVRVFYAARGIHPVITFIDSSHLELNIPGVTWEEGTIWEYKMQDTLYTWKRNYDAMQLCGVKLKVKREADGYEDWITLCKAGDFTKAISDRQKWQKRGTKDKTFILELFGLQGYDKGGWSNSTATAKMSLSNFDSSERERKAAERESKKHNNYRRFPE